jgi:hypothetical protein
MNADMEARYTLALSEGRVITDNEAQLSLLLSVILRHLPFLHMNHGALDTDPEVDDLAGRGALAQEMRATGFSDWADRLENRRVRTRLLDAANDAAIDLLMGRAAGRYFSANMNPGMIPIVDNVFMAFPDAWRDFGEMACHDIRNDSARKLELLKFTSERVALFEDNITNKRIDRFL